MNLYPTTGTLQYRANTRAILRRTAQTTATKKLSPIKICNFETTYYDIITPAITKQYTSSQKISLTSNLLQFTAGLSHFCSYFPRAVPTKLMST